MWYRTINSVLLLALLGGLPACDKSPPQNRPDSYPWQITLMPDGSSRIFGIHLGVTTVREAKQQLGDAPATALFENPDGKLSLELFYKEFDRAGLSGKVVLSVHAEQAVLQEFKQHSFKRDHLESGVLQYRLDATALNRMETWPVTAMTYIPYADLAENIILSRFGKPAQKIRSHPEAQHWLYPDKGLDLIVNDNGKEILQYVPPKEFAKLERPLHP